VRSRRRSNLSAISLNACPQRIAALGVSSFMQPPAQLRYRALARAGGGRAALQLRPRRRVAGGALAIRRISTEVARPVHRPECAVKQSGDRVAELVRRGWEFRFDLPLSDEQLNQDLEAVDRVESDVSRNRRVRKLWWPCGPPSEKRHGTRGSSRRRDRVGYRAGARGQPPACAGESSPRHRVLGDLRLERLARRRRDRCDPLESRRQRRKATGTRLANRAAAASSGSPSARASATSRPPAGLGWWITRSSEVRSAVGAE